MRNRPSPGRADGNRSRRQNSLRAPCVAGLFYPAERGAVEEWIRRATPPRPRKEEVVGLLVPHGPYRRCAQVMGTVLSAVSPAKRVVLVGPDHTGADPGCRLAARGVWETPLGKVEVDSELARLLRKGVPELSEDRDGLEREHSAEVVLPFLQRLWGLRQFVPIATAAVDPAFLVRLGNGLARAVQQVGEKVLLVATAQLAGHEAREPFRRQGDSLLEAIRRMDAEDLLKQAGAKGATLCGAGALAALLVASKALGASAGNLVKYEIWEGSSGGLNAFAGVLFR